MQPNSSYNPSDLSFRAATPEDKPFAHKVHHAAYHDIVVKQFGSWDAVEQDKFFESTWARYDSEIIYINSKPCGYWAVEYTASEIRLHELLLLPKFQSRGIGTMLLGVLVDTARARSLPIKLQAFTQSRAVKLYQRAGFKEIGRTLTHIRMEFRPSGNISSPNIVK